MKDGTSPLPGGHRDWAERSGGALDGSHDDVTIMAAPRFLKLLCETLLIASAPQGSPPQPPLFNAESQICSLDCVCSFRKKKKPKKGENTPPLSFISSETIESDVACGKKQSFCNRWDKTVATIYHHCYPVDAFIGSRFLLSKHLWCFFFNFTSSWVSS